MTPALKCGLAALAAASVVHAPARAFSQYGGAGATPAGHEWITARAALEVLGERGYTVAAGDPRHGWPASSRARAATFNNPTLLGQIQHAAFHGDAGLPTVALRYELVHSAVMGVRWVDYAGSLVGGADGGYRCFFAVAQNPSILQHDHFLRARDEAGSDGARRAINDSISRFRNYFVNAANSGDEPLRIKDGGAVETASVNVLKRGFLLGRAAHLLQDSFSPEHGIRYSGDHFRSVHGMKSFVCSEGSFRHTTHGPISGVGTTIHHDGDIIFTSPTSVQSRSDISGAQMAHLRPQALAALEATKDLWAAYLRVRALPAGPRRLALARTEAQALINYWFHVGQVDGAPERGVDPHWDHDFVVNHGSMPRSNAEISQAACDHDIGYSCAEVANARALCSFNMVDQGGGTCEHGDFPRCDPQLKIPFNWHWRRGFPLVDRPAGYHLASAADGCPTTGSSAGTRAASSKAPASKKAPPAKKAAAPAHATPSKDGPAGK